MDTPSNNNRSDDESQPASGRSEGPQGTGATRSSFSSVPAEAGAPSVAATQSSAPMMRMGLEDPSGDGDTAPVPAAQIAASYEDMEDTIKSSIENTQNDDDAAPVPPAQITALYEEMENSIKNSIENTQGDDDAPLPPAQLAAIYEEEEKGSAEMKLEIIEDNETRMSLGLSSNVQHPPTVTLSSNESRPSLTTPREDGEGPSNSRSQHQAPVVVMRPPPPSMLPPPPADETITPSIPMFRELEATPVQDVPEAPIYDAVPIQPLPRWKKHLRYILVGFIIIIGALVATLGIVLGLKNSTDGDENNDESFEFVASSFQPSKSSSPSQNPSLNPTFQPSQSFAPSHTPSLRPTFQPSKSSAPSTSHHPSQTSNPSTSLVPSTHPSTSFAPSTYWSSLYWNQQGPAIIGEVKNDWFGRSLSLSADGMIMAIGAPYSGGINGDESGLVKVYRKEGERSSWNQLGQTIHGEAGDRTGSSVVLSEDGRTLAIGSPLNSDNGDASGQVRVYSLDDDEESSWKQLGQTINGEAAEDNLGRSEALSADGKTLAIGSPYNGDKGIWSGNVKIYGWDEAALDYKQLGQTINGEAAHDNLGLSVALSSDGKTLAIGAPNNGDGGLYSGHVKIYVWDEAASNYEQLGKAINGEAADDYFGGSLALSSDGKTLAVGAPELPWGSSMRGHVKVYGWDEVSSLDYKQIGQTIYGEVSYGLMGSSVALSADGKTLAIGAPGDFVYGRLKVYGLESDGLIWKQLGHTIEDKLASNIGKSAALSADGKTLATGSPYFNNNNVGSSPGQVMVYNVEY